MRVDQAVNIEDLHRMAKRRLPKIMFDYIEGGVEDERGLSRNEAAFHKHRLLPRYLVEDCGRDQSAALFGHSYASPFGIAPTGVHVTYDAAAFLRSRRTQLCAAWVLGDLEYLKKQLDGSDASS